MSSLIGSLGLDDVQSDPNALPDGRWAGEVFKSELVNNKKNSTVAHVITYKVTEGKRKGAQRTDWNTLGKDPVFAEGHDGDFAHLESMTNTMDDTAKRWYKKIFTDLGIPEAEVSNTSPEDLVGLPVTFGTKKNGEWINISFVELRKPTAGAGIIEDTNPPVTPSILSGNVPDMF